MMNITKTNEPVVLIIFDGWGLAPDSESNAITNAPHPNYDFLDQNCPQARLWAHGEYVGLLKDQDGNSEAGHLNLGSGRIVKQDSVIVSDSINDGTFFKNPAFLECIQHVKRNNSSMHLIGMLSDGESAHSTPEHYYALLDLMEKEKVEKVFLHLFSDGRDSSPQSGKKQTESIIRRLRKNQSVATLMGRFFAMDRKKEWGRTQKAYNALVLGEGLKTSDFLSVFDKYYSRGESDEYIDPHVFYKNGKPEGRISDNDSVIFFNHRSDRARQITKVFAQSDFFQSNPGSFEPKKKPRNLRFAAMTDFGPDLGDIITAYPSANITDTLPMILKSKRQLYITEKEKYAHMTYFFNGGYPDPVGGESRIMIPSPDVDSYDKQPEMSTPKIRAKVVQFLREKKFDFIAVNFACPDMVGHTGNFEAGKLTVRAVDKELGFIISEMKNSGGVLIVTADHGNIEEMKDLSTGQIDTKHSKNQVPFILWSSRGDKFNLKKEGILGDVAPTVLDLFGIEKPRAMTGKSLIIR